MLLHLQPVRLLRVSSLLWRISKSNRDREKSTRSRRACSLHSRFQGKSLLQAHLPLLLLRICWDSTNLLLEEQAMAKLISTKRSWIGEHQDLLPRIDSSSSIRRPCNKELFFRTLLLSEQAQLQIKLRRKRPISKL